MAPPDFYNSPAGSAAPTEVLPGGPPIGGPKGSQPLIRALRAQRLDGQKVGEHWVDRYSQDSNAALAELVNMLLIVAGAPVSVSIGRGDIQGRHPCECVDELAAALAAEASDNGHNFEQHWLVYKEKAALKVRENFPVIWCQLVATAPASFLMEGGLIQALKGWLLALAETQFRGLRHAATVACLGVVEGLCLHVLRLEEYSASMELAAPGPKAPQSARATELEQTIEAARSIAVERDGMGATLLSRRAKDSDAEIRASCFEGLGRLAACSSKNFQYEQWGRYFWFGLADASEKVRRTTLLAFNKLLEGAWGAPPTSAFKDLCIKLKPRVNARCLDHDPSVGAAGIMCAFNLAAGNFLDEADVDAVVDHIWSVDPERRAEAAKFVNKMIFHEDLLEVSQPRGGCGLFGGATAGAVQARRQIMSLVEFLCEYSKDHYELAERLVSGFWGQAPCLKDWEAMTGLLLQENGVEAMAREKYLALVYLAEATIHQGMVDLDLASKGQTEGTFPDFSLHVLKMAARALVTKLPALLLAYQAEPHATSRVASICRYLLQHCARQGSSGPGGFEISGPAAEAIGEAFKAAFLRQQKPDTLENLSQAMLHLLELSPSACSVAVSLATELQERLTDCINGEAQEAALLAAVKHLRMMAKVIDVSLCKVRGLVGMLLDIMKFRAQPEMKDELKEESVLPVTPQLAVAVLELLVLLAARHICSLLKPSKLVHITAHDLTEAEELESVPRTIEGFLYLCTVLLKSDPNKFVRLAALAAAVSVLSVWWNCEQAALQEGFSELPALGVNQVLGSLLTEQLGKVLQEANLVPPDSAKQYPDRDPAIITLASASQLFQVLENHLGNINMSACGPAHYELPDSEKVRVAILACALCEGCYHTVSKGTITTVVLSQGLSMRPDLQEVAWHLLRRLRRESLPFGGEKAQAFFTTLVSTVKTLHEEANAEKDKEQASALASKLLQHVAVGKLPLKLQVAFLAALRAGAMDAFEGVGKDGFLKALIPFVTKRIVEDAAAAELKDWVENEVQNRGEEIAAKAGADSFLKASRQALQRPARSAAA